jgi:hypothetical protein
VSDFEEILAGAKRPEHPVPLCLRGDLVGRHAELEQQLQTASRASTLGRRSDASVLAEEIKALEEQITASKRTFWLRAMDPREWSDFWAEKPERGKDEEEAPFKQRWYVWVCEMVSRCAFDPVMTPEQVDRLVPNLSGAQWDQLSDAAYGLNAKGVVVPFSLAASALTPSDEQSSKPQ